MILILVLLIPLNLEVIDISKEEYSTLKREQLDLQIQTNLPPKSTTNIREFSALAAAAVESEYSV